MDTKFNTGDIVAICPYLIFDTNKIWTGKITKIDNLFYFIDNIRSSSLTLVFKKIESKYLSVYRIDKFSNKEEYIKDYFYMRELNLKDKIKLSLT